MCGLSGIVQLDTLNNLTQELECMNRAIEHRGRDKSDFWRDGVVGLAHNRLAILDLSSRADQPMTSENGRFVFIYNGEVFNYKELRKELENEGISINSSGDTEVVFQSIIKWGMPVVKKFNGMFAFAFYDKLTKKLFICRDRYGIKPLYYTINSKKIYFASEEKAFKSMQNFQSVLDLEAVVEYFTFQNIFSNKTFYKNVHSLEPGTYLEISIQDSLKIKKIRYWDFDFNEEKNLDNEDEIHEEVERLLVQAVKRQLASDVGVGQYLSGGIDTGLIASVVSDVKPNTATFTVGFDTTNVNGLELGFDESEAALGVATYFGLSNFKYQVKPGDMQDVVKKLTWILDTPRVGQSYPNYFAARLASEHVKVVLSGTGSDEIFGGYPWRYFNQSEMKSFEVYADEYYKYWQRLIKDEDKSKFFNPIKNQISQVDTKAIFLSILAQHEKNRNQDQNPINNSLYFEAKTFLNGLLNIEDKIHMNAGIENRVPFLDNDLVDFASKIPIEFKLIMGDRNKRIDENIWGDKKRLDTSNSSGKVVLQGLYRKRIPGQGGWHRKQGFSGPDGSWFKGPSLEYISNQLMKREHSMYEIISFDAVRENIDSHLSGKKNQRLLIWALLTMKNWIDINQ